MTTNVSSVINRMAAIQSTIAGQPPKTADPTPAPPDSFAMMLDQLIGGGVSPNYGLGANPYLVRGNIPEAGTSFGAPPGLEGHANGRLAPELLVPIAGGADRLWAPAANAYETMAAAAAQDGIRLGISDGYRSLDDQHRLAGELGLYDQGGLAAHPGTSQHGWGRAVDLELDDTVLSWMRNNAARFGFHETVPREPWHWEFHGA